jgi:hypothetical protein
VAPKKRTERPLSVSSTSGWRGWALGRKDDGRRGCPRTFIGTSSGRLVRSGLDAVPAHLKLVGPVVVAPAREVVLAEKA